MSDICNGTCDQIIPHNLGLIRRVQDANGNKSDQAIAIAELQGQYLSGRCQRRERVARDLGSGERRGVEDGAKVASKAAW